MSARASTRWLRICSGATYSARATIDPCRVSPPARGGVLGQPEVAEVHVVLAGEQDIRGLDVAVQHPAGVGRVERRADLADDARGPQRLDASLGSDQRAQVGALDEPHHDVQHAVLFAGVEDRDHVRVVDRGRDPRLAPEALAEAFLPGVLGEDELEGHRALQRELLGPVDDPHVSVADHLLDAAPREHGAQREASRAATRVRRGCRGGEPCSGAGSRRGGGAEGGGAAGAGRRPGGRGRRAARQRGRLGRASVNSRVVEPTRTESPTFSTWRPRTRSPFTNVPFAEPRSSIVSSPPASRATRAWRRESSPSSLSLPGPLTSRPITSSSPGVEPAAQRAPGGDHQHRTRAGVRTVGSAAGAFGLPGRDGSAGAGAVGHLEDRPAHSYDVTDLERPRGVDALVVHERPVRRPEILDREPTVGPRARRVRDGARVSGSPPSLPSSSGASRPISRSASTLRSLPRSLPSVTRSCSPAIGLEAYASAAASASGSWVRTSTHPGSP